MICELLLLQRLHDFSYESSSIIQDPRPLFFQHGIAIQMQLPDTQCMVYLPTCC